MKSASYNPQVSLLCKQVQAKDASSDAAFNQLWSQFLRFAIATANRIAVQHTSDRKDLVLQACRLGIWQAAMRYDPDKGAFTTYASWWIKNSVHDALGELMTSHSFADVDLYADELPAEDADSAVIRDDLAALRRLVDTPTSPKGDRVLLSPVRSRMAEHTESNADELFKAHEGYAYWIASKIFTAHDAYMRQELRSAAALGLLEAIRRYDPTQGVKLTTYSYFWIRKEVLAALANERISYGHEDIDHWAEEVPDEQEHGLQALQQDQEHIRYLVSTCKELTSCEASYAHMRWVEGLRAVDIVARMGYSKQRASQLEQSCLTKLGAIVKEM